MSPLTSYSTPSLTWELGLIYPFTLILKMEGEIDLKFGTRWPLETPSVFDEFECVPLWW